MRIAVPLHDGMRSLGQSDHSIQDASAGLIGLLRSAFRPATRLVRQWVKECQQPGAGEASTVSCLSHGLAQLRWPTLPRP